GYTRVSARTTMTPATYSFPDVVVLGDVRERFVAGDALVILSTDLERIVWANGPGAALFGHPDVIAAMGAASGLGTEARRQITATSGFPAIGRNRPIALCLASGSDRLGLEFNASSIAMPDGQPAILLTG